MIGVPQTKPRIKANRGIIIAFALVVAAGLGYTIWKLESVDHLDRDAGQTLQVVLDDDPRKLYNLMLPEERRLLAMSPDTWTAAYNELIAPRLALMHPAGHIETELDSDEGEASIVVEDAAGHRGNISLDTWPSEEGGRADISSMLIDAWVIEYARSKGKMGVRSKLEAQIEGLEHDKARLMSYGWKGFVNIDFTSGRYELVPWNDWDARLRKNLAETSDD